MVTLIIMRIILLGLEWKIWSRGEKRFTQVVDKSLGRSKLILITRNRKLNIIRKII